MKFIKFESQTSDVRYDVELAPIDRQDGSTCHMTFGGVTALKSGYSTADVLASALDSVDVPDGIYAVWLLADCKEMLTFILVDGDKATEIATPKFAKPQKKPFMPYNYEGTQETCNVHVCDMGTGITTCVRGDAVVDGATSSVSLSDSITGSLNDGIYCARTNTRTAGYLTFFRVHHGTVKYLHTPAFIQHKGHWIYV